MKILCVYIDVNQPEQQLDSIADYLDHFNAGIRAGERLWFVKTGKKPQQIRDEIQALSIPEGYKILVFEAGDKWSTFNAKDDVTSWMGKHV